jgi:hypothetical protein
MADIYRSTPTAEHGKARPREAHADGLRDANLLGPDRGFEVRHAELTGLKRLLSVRTFWGRERLVLQLQERGLHTTCSAGQIDTQWVTRWRDATAGDLTITNVSLGHMLAPTDGAPEAPRKVRTP